MTLTLELPDDLAARIENVPLEQRNNYAMSPLRIGAKLEDEEAGQTTFDLTEGDIASIRRGLADSKARRITAGNAFFARLFERVGLPAPKKHIGNPEGEDG